MERQEPTDRLGIFRVVAAIYPAAGAKATLFYQDLRFNTSRETGGNDEAQHNTHIGAAKGRSPRVREIHIFFLATGLCLKRCLAKREQYGRP